MILCLAYAELSQVISWSFAKHGLGPGRLVMEVWPSPVDQPVKIGAGEGRACDQNMAVPTTVPTHNYNCHATIKMA